MSPTTTTSFAPAGTPINAQDADRVKLFQPFTQKSITMHNRIGVPPMCMYSAKDGHLTDFHVMHYGSFALKGPGLVIIEATAVVPEGRITSGCSGLWDDSQVPALKRVVDMIRSQGSVPGLQLGHAGRKASTTPPFVGDYLVSEKDGGWPENVYGPTDEPFADHYAKPHAMTVDQIKQTVQDFAHAAVRANNAGVELLEIHCAHGYLLSSFCSPSSNKRTDKYGGSFENRTRFIREVVQAVRAVWPKNKPLWIRLSCSDYTNPDPMAENPEGWDIYQTIRLAKELKQLGVDTIDCSSGGIVKGVKYPGASMYQVQFAEAIRKEAGIATAAVGLIIDAEDAEEILQKDKADFILVGRDYLRNSNWALSAAQSLDVEITWPKQYSWAVKKARRHNTQKAQEHGDKKDDDFSEIIH